MKDLLLKIMTTQKRELAKLKGEGRVTRGQLEDFSRILDSRLIKAVLGPRRAGKSTLIVQSLYRSKKKFGYLNFEDELLPQKIDTHDLLEAIDKVYSAPEIIFFDEIQLLPRWEQFLNRLERLGYNIIVSGSNSKLLSGELASSLTGRYIAREVFPFDYDEFCDGLAIDRTSRLSIERYLSTGGYPEVALAKSGAEYLSTLFDAVLHRDIVSRKKLRNGAKLAKLAKLYVANCARRFSGRSFERALDTEISIATIEKYLAYLEEAYLIKSVPRFSAKIKLRLSAERKAYLIDPGMFEAVHSGVGKSLSIQLEIAVLIELLRNGFKIGESLFYFQTKSNKYEVDFLTIDKNDKVSLIQVATSLDDPQAEEREARALYYAQRELPEAKAYIITLGEPGLVRYRGKTYPVINMIDWCKRS